MQITYRRTGGILTLIAFSALGLAAMTFTVAVAAGALIGAMAIGAVALLVRAITPKRWWQRRAVVGPPAEWPGRTIDVTALPERRPEAPEDRRAR